MDPVPQTPAAKKAQYVATQAENKDAAQIAQIQQQMTKLNC